MTTHGGQDPETTSSEMQLSKTMRLQHSDVEGARRPLDLTFTSTISLEVDLGHPVIPEVMDFIAGAEDFASALSRLHDRPTAPRLPSSATTKTQPTSPRRRRNCRRSRATAMCQRSRTKC